MSLSTLFRSAIFLLLVLVTSCLKSQTSAPIKLACGFIAHDDKDNPDSDHIRWKPTRKLGKAININLNSTRDTILIDYVSKISTFIKEDLSEPEKKTIREQIGDFRFTGSFRRDEGDGLYNHFYLSKDMDLLILIKDKPGHIVFRTLHLRKDVNPLKNVIDLNAYIDVEEGKKYNGPVHLGN